MDASTTINQMLSGNKIFVPTYQRAYSWEDKQTKQFLVDLQDYVESHTASSYYFGHFCSRIKVVAISPSLTVNSA